MCPDSSASLLIPVTPIPLYSLYPQVWSLGCILYELLTSKHAFEASSINGLVRKIMKGRGE